MHVQNQHIVYQLFQKVKVSHTKPHSYTLMLDLELFWIPWPGVTSPVQHPPTEETKDYHGFGHSFGQKAIAEYLLFFSHVSLLISFFKMFFSLKNVEKISVLEENFEVISWIPYSRFKILLLHRSYSDFHRT